MPHTNTWEEKGLYRQFTDVVSGDEIMESNLELHQDARFDTAEYVINDFTHVIGHQVSVNHTRAYALTDDIVSDRKPNLKVALVVDREPLVALAKNYCNFMEDKSYQCAIFEKLADAYDWVQSK